MKPPSETLAQTFSVGGGTGVAVRDGVGDIVLEGVGVLVEVGVCVLPTSGVAVMDSVTSGVSSGDEVKLPSIVPVAWPWEVETGVFVYDPILIEISVDVL